MQAYRRDQGVRAYARHRGVNHNAVRKAIAAKRIDAAVTWVARGSARVPQIDFAKADQEWVRNTDPAQKPEVAGGLFAGEDNDCSGGAGEAGAGGSDPAGVRDDPAVPTYQDYRTKRERYQAEKAELDYLAAVGRLVDAGEVERNIAEIFGELKNQVFRLPAKQSAAIAAETDPARCERLLMDALTQVFNESSRNFAVTDAGGVEGRAHAM